jgi:hypothetical protein
MRLGLIEGVHRRRHGKYGRRTISTATARDRVERNFTAAAPNQLRVADMGMLQLRLTVVKADHAAIAA